MMIVTLTYCLQQGCLSKLITEIEANAWYVAAVGIAVLVLEVLGIIFALCLCCGLRKTVY